MMSEKDLDEKSEHTQTNYIFNITPMDIDGFDFIVIHYGMPDYMVSGNMASQVVEKFREFLKRHEFDIPLIALPYFMKVKGMSSEDKKNVTGLLKNSLNELVENRNDASV